MGRMAPVKLQVTPDRLPITGFCSAFLGGTFYSNTVRGQIEIEVSAWLSGFVWEVLAVGRAQREQQCHSESKAKR